MATASLGSLVANLVLESASFHRDMGRAAKAVQSDTAKIRKSMRGVERSTREVQKSFAQLKAGIAALGLGLVVKDIIRVSAEFQRLKASLKTVTGSTDAANKAFAQIKNFAATTPFDLQQVTAGFIKLKALGLDPSEAALRSYGNTASAMGKSLNDFVEAVADAITGEFERLKEFGIKAASEGDRVKFTFQGLTTEIGKNATEIEAFLRKIGENQFAGAMEEQAATLGGALSNLGDSIAVIQNEIGDGGLASAVSDIARGMSDAANSSHNLARSLGAGLGTVLRTIAENFRLLTAAVSAFVAFKLAGVFFAIGTAVIAYGRAMKIATTTTAAFTAVLAANPIGLIAVAISAAVAGLVLFNDKVLTIGDTTFRVGELISVVWGSIGEVFNIVTGYVSNLARAILNLVTGEWRAAIDSFRAGGASITQGIEAIRNAWATLGVELRKNTADPFSGYVEAVNAANARTKALTQSVKELVTEFLPLTAAESIDPFGGFAKAVEDAEQRTRDLAKAAKESQQKLEDEAQAVREAIDPIVRYNAEVERLRFLLENTTLSQKEFNEAVRQARERMEDAQEKTKELSDEARAAGQAFEDAFVDAIIEGKKLSDVLRALLKDLARIALKAATKPITEKLGGIFGDIITGGSPSSGASFAATATSFAPAGGNLFATGGAHSGGMRLVGERGPELEVTGPSRIFSAAKTAKMVQGVGGGGNITVVNHNDLRNSEPGSLARAELMMQESERRTLASLKQQIDSGGRWAKTVGRRRGSQ
jgi:hypothetical protein